MPTRWQTWEATRLECLYDLAHGNPTGLSKGAARRLKKEATPEELSNAGFPVSATEAPAATASADGAQVPGTDSDGIVDLEMEETDWEKSAEFKEHLKRLGLQCAVKIDPKSLYAQPPPPPTNTVDQAGIKDFVGKGGQVWTVTCGPGDAVFAPLGYLCLHKVQSAGNHVGLKMALASKDDVTVLSQLRQDFHASRRETKPKDALLAFMQAKWQA